MGCWRRTAAAAIESSIACLLGGHYVLGSGFGRLFSILSKSELNKRSCTILYFSNSVSANALATSAATLPEVSRISRSLNCKNASSFVAQSSMVIGIFRKAMLSRQVLFPSWSAPCVLCQHRPSPSPTPQPCCREWRSAVCFGLWQKTAGSVQHLFFNPCWLHKYRQSSGKTCVRLGESREFLPAGVQNNPRPENCRFPIASGPAQNP